MPGQEPVDKKMTLTEAAQEWKQAKEAGTWNSSNEEHV